MSCYTMLLLVCGCDSPILLLFYQLSLRYFHLQLPEPRYPGLVPPTTPRTKIPRPGSTYNSQNQDTQAWFHLQLPEPRYPGLVPTIVDPLLQLLLLLLWSLCLVLLLLFVCLFVCFSSLNCCNGSMRLLWRLCKTPRMTGYGSRPTQRL